MRMNPYPAADPEFRAMVRELTEEEKKALRESLRQRGCMEPILTWNGLIIDGYQQAEICAELFIPVRSIELQFPDRESALAWICRNELKKPELTETKRKYLLGKLMLCRKEQWRKEKLRRDSGITMYGIENEIRLKYGIKQPVLQKYAHFAEAMDRIGAVSRELYAKILNETVYMAMQTAMQTAEEPETALTRIAEQILKDGISIVRRSYIRERLQEWNGENGGTAKCVKDTPAHDPDFSVSGLILTIPAWRYSLNRIREESAYPKGFTEQAREDFRQALLELRELADGMISEL